MNIIDVIVEKINHYWYKVVRVFKKPHWSKESDSPIEFAFNSGGVDYYMYTDPMAQPCQRGFMSIAIYEQFNMRVTREHLEASLIAIKSKINAKDGEIKLTEIIDIVNDLQSRLDWVVEIDTTYKLASVLFFDVSEDPTTYNWIYNEQKIKRWKRCGVRDFFLQLPLKELIPYLKYSRQSMETYLKIIQKLSVNQTEVLLLELSKAGVENSLVQGLKSQMEALRELEI